MSDQRPEPDATDPPCTGPITCSACGGERDADAEVCPDCGLIHSARRTSDTVHDGEHGPSPLLNGRFRLSTVIGERLGVIRFLGEDHSEDGSPVPVQLLRQGIADDAETPAVPPWPSVGWEKSLLERCDHPALPRVLDHFTEAGWEYLAETRPAGTPLWDFWDDPAEAEATRYAHLVRVAEGLRALAEAGAILETLRPESVVITTSSAVIHDLSDLLPVPLPDDPPLRGTAYTAPELLLSPQSADAKAGLYGFGAMLGSLLLGRELTEIDFHLHGVPKAFADRFPDGHPLLARLIGKTFVREPDLRFPTDPDDPDDPHGYMELIRNLAVCVDQLGRLRFDVAACSTTGMIRAGNEDTVAIAHEVECLEDSAVERALIVLADGMGGLAHGEVAAALAVRTLREEFSRDHEAELDDLTVDALIAANRAVYEAAEADSESRGMGCTAEVVWLEGHQMVIGHVGDSRVYLLRGGRFELLTTDHTFVQRMVDLGHMSQEEAEVHPRRSELMQALGGREDVEPELIEWTLRPGDKILVCSDGLSGLLSDEAMVDILTGAKSAARAARRLINASIHGHAFDNVTAAVAFVMD